MTPREPTADLPHRAVLDRSISDFDRTVLWALMHWLPRGAVECVPSNAEIAGRVGRHEGTVARALRSLEMAGYLDRVEDATVRGVGRRLVLRYRTSYRAPAPPPPTLAAIADEDEGDTPRTGAAPPRRVEGGGRWR